MKCKLKFETTKPVEDKVLIGVLDGLKFRRDFKFKVLKGSISLESECKTATQLVLAVDKDLKKKLGKKLKIGVKGFEVKDYVLNFEIEKFPKKEITLPFVDELKIDGNTVNLKFKKLDESFVRNNCVERIIKLVEEKIDKHYYEGKAEHHEILYESVKRKNVWDKDPTVEMEKLGWLCKGPTKGKWIYKPEFTAIVKAMERLMFEEILEPLGFQEVIASNVVSEEIWKKTGHLEGMPMEIYYVAEPKTRNVEEWEPFVDKLKITKEVPYDEYVKMLKLKPLRGLTYAQCPIMYYALEGCTVANESLPILWVDRKQNSFRYESGGRHGIERVDEFHRIEPIYIGTPEQMIKIKDKLFARYKKVFDEILEIEWRTAWVTPFYMQQAGETFKNDDEKIKGTIDFEAWLPYKGSRDKEWLEFQNLSIIGDKYTKVFNIKSQKGELWSGCSGICLERWAVVFLSQKGIDPAKWPKGFKKYLSKIPKGVKIF
jgi:seryl-tRNA synthetase